MESDHQIDKSMYYQWHASERGSSSPDITAIKKVFLHVILNLIQLFISEKQCRMKTKFQILSPKFERKSYNFILNNCSGFIEMML